MFRDWYETDPDCCQYMRRDGDLYEMIQAVWMDTTEADKANGLHEYVIVNGCIDLDGYDEVEREMYIHPYGYSIETIYEEYGVNGGCDLIAECILEEEIMHDGCIINHADTFEEVKEIVEKYIRR